MLVNQGLEGPTTQSIGAVNVGNSVIAMKYKDGIIMVTDLLISYGNTKDYKHQKRIEKLSGECAIAASGEVSDFQEIMKKLSKKAEDDEIANDGATFLHARDYYHYLASVQY